MPSSRWARAHELFNQARRLPAEKIEDLLHRECGPDEALRREVESLLEHYQEEFLESPAHLPEVDSTSCPESIGPYKIVEVLGEGDLTKYLPAEGAVSGAQRQREPTLRAVDVQPGDRLEHYLIEEKLGEGGMGVVYRGRDERLDRPVAIKLLLFRLLVDEALRQRFLDEARLASSLNHPNICTVYDVGNFRGADFIVMEMVDGETLRELLERDGPFSEGATADLALDVCAALSVAHRSGIIHRDIKPDNIMISRDGFVKVMDFGLAKLAADVSEEVAFRIDAPQHAPSPGSRGFRQTGYLVTMSGLLGTASYMSPEQVQVGKVDQRTDLFSIGVMIYELLTGVRPFRGEVNASIFESIVSRSPDPVAELRADLSPEWQGILSRLLEKDMQRRVGSMEELAQALEKLRSALGLPSSRAGPVARRQRGCVAVLDFENLSRDTELDWLSDGIPESITADLRKLSALHVASREAVAQVMAPLAGKQPTIEEVCQCGQKLKADWIVSGSFQALGGAIRLTAQFTDVSIGEVFASEKVDGKLDEAFALQDAIVLRLAGVLQLDVPESEVEKVERPQTSVQEAFEHYAKAIQLVNRLEPSAFGRAVELLGKAVEADPKYALAHSGLGRLHVLRFAGSADPHHLRVGVTHLKRALKLDPDLADAFVWMTYARARQKRFEEAIKCGCRAIDLEPEDFAGQYNLGVAYLQKAAFRHTPEVFLQAVQKLKTAVSLQPNFHPARVCLAWCYLLHGQYDDARAHLERIVALETSDKFSAVRWAGGQTLLASLLLREGRLEEAESVSRRALQALVGSEFFYTRSIRIHTLCILGRALHGLRSNEAALESLTQARDFALKQPSLVASGYFLAKARVQLATVLHTLGDSVAAKAEHRAAMHGLRKRGAFDFSWYPGGSDAETQRDVACYHAAAGHRKMALRNLRKAIEYGWRDRAFLESSDVFRDVRSDPEWKVALEVIDRSQPLP